MVRAQVDYLVDRAQLQARQRVQASATNSPSSSSQKAGTSTFRDRTRCCAMRPPGWRGAAGRGRFCPREHPPRARPWRRGSPDPIPNSEVKPAIAESTAAPGCGRIGRRARGGCFCFLQAPGPCRPGGLPRVGAVSYTHLRSRVPFNGISKIFESFRKKVLDRMATGR